MWSIDLASVDIMFGKFPFMMGGEVYGGTKKHLLDTTRNLGHWM
jgi:hypothetical protein